VARPDEAAAPPAPPSPDALAQAERSEAPASEAPAASARSTPVATRTVAPEYPSSVRSGRRARVELSFSVGTDGAVRDIKVVAEPLESAFTRAAQRALSQWRFDPATIDRGKGRYRQAFVFAPEGDADVAAADAGGCVRRTGSLLCQRSESAEESAPLDERRLAAAARGSEGRAVADVEQAGQAGRSYRDEAEDRAALYRRLERLNRLTSPGASRLGN
jgi:TonB family protein